MSKRVNYTGLTKVQFNDGFCGSGKTHWMIDKVSQSGKYVIAVDRREVIPERIRLIKEKLGAAKLLRLRHEAIHSDDTEFADALKKTQSVSSQIFGKMAEFESASHAIIFITHAGMKLCDFRSNDPAGWTLIIDEVPSLAETGHHTTPNSYDFLSQNYAISSSTSFPAWAKFAWPIHISAPTN